MERNDPAFLERVWCVLPVYNNKDTVKEVALECRSEMPRVLVVDDGSTDTDVEALFAGSGIPVLRHGRNRGKGEAILTALRYIKAQGGRFMITIDADGQHHPRDIGKFLPLLEDDDATIVVGSRRLDGKNVPKASTFGRELGNFWLRVETGVSLSDSQSGFRAYPVEYLSRMKFSGSRFEFEVEVLTRAAWAGLRLRSVEVDVWYPEPRSRVSRFRPVADNVRIGLMHARLVGRRLVPLPHRRLLSSAEGHFDARVLFRPVEMLKGLLKESVTPSLLAASAAVGTFLATLPLIGVHTLVIVYVATRLQLNRVMAVSIQNLCMPPFVPVVCIELGYRMRYGGWLTEFSTKTVIGELHERLFEWFLGSLVVAPVIATLVGGVVFLGARAMESSEKGQRTRARG